MSSHEGNKLEHGAEAPVVVTGFEVVKSSLDGLEDPFGDTEELAREGQELIEGGKVNIDELEALAEG